MRINIEKILANPVLAKVAAEHLAYSLQDVEIYEDLTPREQSIINKESFDEIYVDASETYNSIKKQNPHHIVLVRAGHFYNTYNEDAEAISNALGITLSNTNSTKKASMPRHTLDIYLPKLVRAGYKVAVYDKV